MCTVPDTTSDVAPIFAGAGCAPLPMTFSVQDAQGHMANVMIDPSGFAHR
jgi:hypothetical protein